MGGWGGGDVLGGAGWWSVAGDGEVGGTTVGLARALEQPVRNPAAAMAASWTILCTTGQRASSVSVTARRLLSQGIVGGT